MFPTGENIEEVITKDRITAKVKNIRTDFKKVCDSGKKSGGGHVVFAFYNLCQGLWGINPAVNTISDGTDSQDPPFQEQESVVRFSFTAIDEAGSESHR